MNERHGELISALLDGELDDDDSQRALSTLLGTGPEPLARFGRYRLIGDAMRGESVVPGGALAAAVHDALRDVPAVLAPPPKRSRQWVRPFAGVAIAASVAAVAVVVAPQMMTRGGTAGGSPQLLAEVPQVQAMPVAAGRGTAGPSGPRPDPTAAAAPRWQALDGELAERLNRLVIEHQEFGGRTGINGPVPHIGLVSYDAR